MRVGQKLIVAVYAEDYEHALIKAGSVCADRHGGYRFTEPKVNTEPKVRRAVEGAGRSGAYIFEALAVAAR